MSKIFLTIEDAKRAHICRNNGKCYKRNVIEAGSTFFSDPEKTFITLGQCQNSFGFSSSSSSSSSKSSSSSSSSSSSMSSFSSQSDLSTLTSLTSQSSTSLTSNSSTSESETSASSVSESSTSESETSVSSQSESSQSETSQSSFSSGSECNCDTQYRIQYYFPDNAGRVVLLDSDSGYECGEEESIPPGPYFFDSGCQQTASIRSKCINYDKNDFPLTIVVDPNCQSVEGANPSWFVRVKTEDGVSCQLSGKIDYFNDNGGESLVCDVIDLLSSSSSSSESSISSLSSSSSSSKSSSSSSSSSSGSSNSSSSSSSEAGFVCPDSEPMIILTVSGGNFGDFTPGVYNICPSYAYSIYSTNGSERWGYAQNTISPTSLALISINQYLTMLGTNNTTRVNIVDLKHTTTASINALYVTVPPTTLGRISNRVFKSYDLGNGTTITLQRGSNW